MIITVRSRWVMRLFWGKRDHYPTETWASHKLWWRWFKQTWLAHDDE